MRQALLDSPIARSVTPPLLVIGMGSTGCRHLLNAHTLGARRLSVFRTGVGAPAGPVPQEVFVETDLEHALSNGTRAVVVSNPTSLHVKTAMAAAKAGCHLLIEKPLSHTLEGLEELQLEVQARRLVAMTGYQFRFHPALQQIRRWLYEDEIGEVISVSAVWGEYLPAWQPWRDYRTSYSARSDLGGGVLLTLSHPIDYLRWFLGEVGRVSAVISRRSPLEIDVEDTALLHLEFKSGVVAGVSLDYVRQPMKHAFTITGTKGVISWDFADGDASLDAGGRRTTAKVPAGFERNQMFLAEMNHFFNCIAGDDEPLCSLDDGERTLRVCLAAQESSRTGRRIDV